MDATAILVTVFLLADGQRREFSSGIERPLAECEETAAQLRKAPEVADAFCIPRRKSDYPVSTQRRGG